MKTRILLTIATITLLLFSSSCSKSKLENKLVGEWKKISVGQIPEGSEITWQFNANGTLYRTTKTSTDTKIDTAQWSVENKFAKKNTLTIENLDDNDDGKHLIHQLDDYLELQRIEFYDGHTDGAFQWNEFEKQ